MYSFFSQVCRQLKRFKRLLSEEATFLKHVLKEGLRKRLVDNRKN